MSSNTNKDEAAGAPLWATAAIRKEWSSACLLYTSDAADE